MRFLLQPRVWKIGLRLFGAGLAVFIGLQFIRPRLDHPPVTADLVAPPSVKAILRTSCYNCHSNETKLSWFDEIVPGYWLVVADVKEARRHLNFSEFGKLPEAQQRAMLFEAVHQMRFRAMPLPQYVLLHPKSKVTMVEIATLENYLEPPGTVEAAGTPADAAAADAQYMKWIAAPAGHAPGEIPPAPNGLPFPPDYRNWKPISTTNRYDNNTMRVILGNDVAARAIAQNNIHPWPDGTAFAKIAYLRQPGANGAVQAGAFKQVEFMVKDAHKYAATEGWGWGRWLGSDLVPYKKGDTSFVTECTGCHAPLRNTDFVFTMPIHDPGFTSELFNPMAALPGDLPYQPLDWKVISTSLDLLPGTMSTLYGNDVAVTHARTSPQGPYPAGSVLALVTWKQQEDRHWFGGRIPGAPVMVEFVSTSNFSTTPPSNSSWPYLYRVWSGSPLREDSSQESNPAFSSGRIQSIVAERAAVMP
jgi:hypothetical protein